MLNIMWLNGLFWEQGTLFGEKLSLFGDKLSLRRALNALWTNPQKMSWHRTDLPLPPLSGNASISGAFGPPTQALFLDLTKPAHFSQPLHTLT